MTFSSERVSLLARKVLKLINLRKLENKDKKVGVVIFNFPPNAVNIGTAAHLDVFSSLYNTLLHLKKLDTPLMFQKIFKSLRKNC